MNQVLSHCVNSNNPIANEDNNNNTNNSSSGIQIPFTTNILQALNVYIPPFSSLNQAERITYYRLIQGILLTLMQRKLTKEEIFYAFSQSHFEIEEVRKVWDKLEEKNPTSFYQYIRHVAGQQNQ
ncbi:hypothetical protein ABK040_014116 [Willaertia magna]